MIPFTLFFKGSSGLMVNIDNILYYTYRITCWGRELFLVYQA